MSHQLIDRNEDLRRIRDDGYCINVVSGNLVVRDVPYVIAGRVVRTDGILISKLNLNGEIVNRPDDHTIKFVGGMPHGVDGKPIAGLGAGADSERVCDALVASYRFSCKPQAGQYPSYYEKIRTYVAILSGPAATIDPAVSARTRRIVEPEGENSPFEYLDTASARAEITAITSKLAVERIAIIGLGGTGAYVLDLVAKTPINEIHIFDGDVFSSHNAFRSPGAASKAELHAYPNKVDYFKAKYSVLHRRIIAHPEYVGAENVNQLQNMSFVFLCMDANPAKRIIVEHLERFGIVFVDTGMGLIAKNEMISGLVSVTTSQSQNRDQARSKMSFATGDADNIYDRNIQVADLNALNAIFAVIKWKKLRSFYLDTANEWHLLFAVRSNLMVTPDNDAD